MSVGERNRQPDDRNAPRWWSLRGWHLSRYHTLLLGIFVAVWVWAAIEPLRGREWLETRMVQADVDTRIRIRYLSTVTPSMRVLWGTRVFEIIAPPIHLQERKRETHLMCREQNNG